VPHLRPRLNRAGPELSQKTYPVGPSGRHIRKEAAMKKFAFALFAVAVLAVAGYAGFDHFQQEEKSVQLAGYWCRSCGPW